MTAGLLAISSLRRINRQMKLKLKSVKDDQLAVRNSVDADHLVLQNLLYEATHLQGQVAAVQDYKGMDETIDLIPVAQFLGEAPETFMSKGEMSTSADPHLLRIARLEYEYNQRQNLTQDLVSLEKEKEGALGRIQETQASLDGVEPLLQSILEATRPAQKFMNISVTERREAGEVADFLPAPLHIIYTQSSAFKDAMAQLGLGTRYIYSVGVRGSVAEAKELVITPEDEEAEDSAAESDEEKEAEASRRRLMRKKSSIYLSPEEMRKKLIQRHPLWVEWVVKVKGSNALLIQFMFLVKLKIVTVKTKALVGGLDDAKIYSEELSSSDNVLGELFPGDDGLQSPNPSNVFMFQKVDAKGIIDFIGKTGKPFLWAQKLAGMDFESDVNYTQDMLPFLPRKEISIPTVERVLKAIKERLSNQSHLQKQVEVLEKCGGGGDLVDLHIPPGAKDLFPPRLHTVFKSWEEMSFGTYSSLGFTCDLLQQEIVNSKHHFYKAGLGRGRFEIQAAVAVSPSFPNAPGIFCVQFEMNERNAMNDAAIRDLEAEVNVHCIPEFCKWKDVIVSLQLARLIQCVDIILETDPLLLTTGIIGESEFPRDKLLLRAGTGRNLRRPFKYVGKGGGYFVSRY